MCRVGENVIPEGAELSQDAIEQSITDESARVVLLSHSRITLGVATALLANARA